jgi:hypothetical protein
MRGLFLAISAATMAASRPVYWGGDWAQAGLVSMHLSYNLTYTLSNVHSLVNSSDTLIKLIQDMQGYVDILGAGGFGYAY